MSRTIEKTLTQLLPTAQSIPPELIQLTSSLLSQSRNKISTLNQTEEPAREMLCAHLAVDRLKSKYDLPSVPDKPPAPVPPKVYKVLFKQFSSTLVVSTSKTPTTTPSKATRTRDALQPTTATSTSANPPVTNPVNTSSRPGRGGRNALSQFRPRVPTEPNAATQPYVEIIAELATHLDALQIVPYLHTAISYISGSAKYKDLLEDVHRLVGSLILLIHIRLNHDAFDPKSRDEREEWYIEQRRIIYNFYKEKGLIGKGKVAREDYWNEKFNTVTMEISTSDMKETRWYLDVPKNGALDVNSDQEGDGEGEDGEDEETVTFVENRKRKLEELEMQSGIGSMMQDRVDYLSGKRRKEYDEWKQKINRYIASGSKDVKA